MGGFKSWWSYWDFERSVKRDLRYVRSIDSEEFLRCVKETAQKRVVKIPEGKIFWRAQLGHDIRIERQGDDEFEVPCAFSAERMKPLNAKSRDGRVNPAGIACLYMATTEKAAISEVRPWLGSLVSLAQFRTKRELLIVDCSRNHDKIPLFLEEPSEEEIEDAVWSHVDRAFAQPVTRDDVSIDYVPTQIISEMFRSSGYHGVAYKSNFGGVGYNLPIFSVDDAHLINCSLKKITAVNVVYSEEDGPYFVSGNGGG